MGSLTINEIIKLIKTIDNRKKLKRKKKMKKNAKKAKQNKDSYFKTPSDHMKGSIITGEHLRTIQENNDLKVKVMENSINNYKNQGITYLQNHENRIYNIENKKNDLSNIPNQSLSRDDVKKYYDVNDNTTVTMSNPEDAYHIESTIPPTKHTNSSPFIEEIEDDDDDEENKNNTSHVTTHHTPSDEESDADPWTDVNSMSDEGEEKQSYNYKFISSDDEDQQTTNREFLKDSERQTTKPSNLTINIDPLYEEKNKSDDEIIEEEEQKDDVNIDSAPKEDEEINDLMLKYLNDPDYKNEFETYFVIDKDTKDYLINTNTNKPMKKNQSMTSKNIDDQNEKKEIYKILKFIGESNPTAKKKVTIYKKFRDYYHEKTGKYI